MQLFSTIIAKLSSFSFFAVLHLPVTISKPTFYGVMGPRFHLHIEAPLLYSFTRPGILQGVFFDNEDDRVQPVFRALPMDVPLWSSWNQGGNVIANTALLQMNQRFYALYERDCPVEVKINAKDKELKMGTRIMDAGICSGHTRSNGITLSYSVMKNTVTLSRRDKSWGILQEVVVPIPRHCGMAMVHDFLLLDDERVLFSVAPFDNFHRLKSGAGAEQTYLVVVNMTDGSATFINTGAVVYLFHFSTAEKTVNQTHFTVYASTYMELDYLKPPHALQGQYYEYEVDMQRGTVKMTTTPDLLQYNLDFPVAIYSAGGGQAATCLRSISANHVFDRLVVCRGLDVLRDIHFPRRVLCSEPAFDNATSSLYGLSWDVEDPFAVYFWKMHWNTCKIRERRLYTGSHRLYHGFHSGLYEINKN